MASLENMIKWMYDKKALTVFIKTVLGILPAQ